MLICIYEGFLILTPCKSRFWHLSQYLHNYRPTKRPSVLVVQRFPPPFSCRQAIKVAGANWCSRSMWEQHTVVYHIGKNVIKTSYLNRWSHCDHSVLDPGQVPQIKGVTRSAVIISLLRYSHQLLILWCTRFPAHEHISGASKIPTVIYYDQSGKVRAVGAEAMKDGICEVAEDENWVKAEW
jgi:hypothetical protein